MKRKIVDTIKAFYGRRMEKSRARPPIVCRMFWHSNKETRRDGYKVFYECRRCGRVTSDEISRVPYGWM
jgi:hypothetical protein